MRFAKKITVALLLTLAFLCWANPAEVTPDAHKVKKQNPYKLPDKLMPLWNSMTLKQKAAQMVMIYMTTPEFARTNEVGGLLIASNHLKKKREYFNTINAIVDSMTIPPFTALDQEGGVVNRLAATSKRWANVPSARQMRAMDSVQIYALAEEISAALKYIRINVNLAPVLDPAEDIHKKPTFMEDSKRSWGNVSNAPKVRAFVKGMRQNGIICTSKHFPGYDSWTNSDLQIAVSNSSRNTIQQNILFFKTLANDIPLTMMSSVEFLKISGRPAVFDPNIVRMARRMSPHTVIITDDLWGTSLRSWASGKERLSHKKYPRQYFKKIIRSSLDADNDILMISFSSKAVDMIEIMLELAQSNDRYRRKIEASAARILKLKYKSGILKIK